MKYLRIAASAFLVLLGSMLIVAWALSLQTVNSIKDGTAAEQLVGTTLRSPQTANLVADKVQVVLTEQVESQVGDVALTLLDTQIHDAIVAFLQSDAFLNSTTTALNAAQDRLLAAVSDPDREPGPLEIDIDLGTRINGAIDTIPVVGTFVPDIDFPEYQVELVKADTFEDVRAGYAAMEFVATWFVWIGLLLIAAGVAVAPRWRRFLPRALIAAGLFGVAIAFVLGTMGARTIATFMPGGRDGGLGTLVEDVLGDVALRPVTDILLALGLIALGLAGVWVLLVRFVPGMAIEKDAATDPAPAGHDTEVGESMTETAELAHVPDDAVGPEQPGEQPPTVAPKKPRPRKPRAPRAP